MMERNFGNFIFEKRKKKELTLSAIAEKLNISAVYLSDIEKGRRNPPEIDMLIKLSAALSLTIEENDEMLDLAGKAREQVAPDLPDYIMQVPEARIALRKARDKSKSGDFWQSVIKKLDNDEDC